MRSRLIPLLLVVPLAALTACSGPAAVPTATTRVTVSASPAPTETVTATPSASASTTPSASASSSGSDPNRPAGQCSDAHLSVGWRPASGGGAAGSDFVQIVFTNGASTACVLRGYPGVSVVGDGNGTQLGVPSGEASGTVRDVHLDANGGQATALLRVTDIGSNGGPYGSKCPVQKGNGYRVYAPHSTVAHFVSRSGVAACTSRVVWMSVSPVTEG